jgi:hypothetical protein
MVSKKKKIVEKTIELALGSSIIGLPNIFRTEKKFLKIIWILLFANSFRSNYSYSNKFN